MGKGPTLSEKRQRQTWTNPSTGGGHMVAYKLEEEGRRRLTSWGGETADELEEKSKHGQQPLPLIAAAPHRVHCCLRGKERARG